MNREDATSAKSNAKNTGESNFWCFRSGQADPVDEEIELLAEQVIGAAIEMHRRLGIGLPEVAYRNAMHHELTIRGIECEPEAPGPLEYKGVRVAEGRVDLLVGKRLVVELKVVEQLGPIQIAQVVAYLAAMNLPLGLLLNFNHMTMKDGIKRVIHTKASSSR